MGNYASYDSVVKKDEDIEVPETVCKPNMEASANITKYSFDVEEKLSEVNEDVNYIQSVLPVEILHEIFMFLNTDSLVEIFSTCSFWKKVTHTQYFWKCYYKNCLKGDEFGKIDNSLSWKRKFFMAMCRRNGDAGMKKKFIEVPFGENESQYNQGQDSSKVVILGESYVGKTSIVLRFIENTFSSWESTIGAAFRTKRLYNVELEKTINLEVWDTSGEQRYRSLAPMYYRGASGAIICYSIDNLESYERAKRWVDEIKRQGSIGVQILLVGTKCDLVEEGKRTVDHEKAKKYAIEENLCGFVETSSKLGINIWVAFGLLAESLIRRVELGKLEEENDFELRPQDGSKESDSVCLIM